MLNFLSVCQILFNYFISVSYILYIWSAPTQVKISRTSGFNPCSGGQCGKPAVRPLVDTGAMVFVVFGILGINRTQRSDNHVIGDLVRHNTAHNTGSHITLQPKTGCPLKLSRVELVSTWMGDLLGKTRLLLEEVLVRPAGGAHPVVCVGPNAPV